MNELIHGAKWWKFDFHNHTPASNDFGKGDLSHAAITPENWLLMYMNAEIDCVAITDHNSGEWIDKLKDALAEMDVTQPSGYRKLYLFPGVEISASGNVHILALFDIESDSRKISALLGAVGFPSESFGTSDTVTDKSVDAVIYEIHKAGGIAIPAHVDKPCGLFTVQTGMTLEKSIKAEGLLAIELIDSSFTKPEIYVQSKLKLAEIIGTDSHIAAQVGTNYTYIKMGLPSLMALKLALHDGEDAVKRKDSITTDPNSIENRYFVKSLRVSNGFRAGNGSSLNLKFSPWLSSVIGGRGSGKSSVVNYLRIGLSRIDEMPHEIQAEFDKFNVIGRSGGAGMLRDNTQIVIEICKDGKLHQITWSNAGHFVQEWEDLLDDWSTPMYVTNIKELFPIQIFNQKELFALTGNPSKLLELIDSQFDKELWNEERDSIVNQWIAQRAIFRQLNVDITEETNFRAALGSVNNKIAVLESSAYRQTLEGFQKYNSLNTFFEGNKVSINQFIESLEEVKEDVPILTSSDRFIDIFNGETEAYVSGVNTRLQLAKSKIEEALEILRHYKTDFEDEYKALPWFETFQTSKIAYEGIVQNLQQSGNESYEDLITRRDVLNERIETIDSKKTEITVIQGNLNNIYEQIILKEKELRTKRNQVITNWRSLTPTSNPFLIIELQQMADISSAEITFRQLLRKTGNEFAGDIFNFNETENWGLLARIINEPENSRWEKRRAELEIFLSATEEDKKNLDLRLARHLDTLKENTPEDIDRLMVWVPEDKLVLKFRKNGRVEDIQTGSAGERTAGMLGLLLALNSTPLIIDQPEDDLDTKLISSFVVDGFKKLKQDRQLMVITHNPNITVNANSDNIIYMKFNNGQITNEGNDALQDNIIRNAVCDVMEGGKDALDKRYYRISKALS